MTLFYKLFAENEAFMHLIAFNLKISKLNISVICFCFCVFTVRLLWDGSYAYIFLSLDATCVLVNILTNCAAPGIFMFSFWNTILTPELQFYCIPIKFDKQMTDNLFRQFLLLPLLSLYLLRRTLSVLWGNFEFGQKYSYLIFFNLIQSSFMKRPELFYIILSAQSFA